MCGICGVLGGVGEPELIAMRDSMTHRGPDAAGMYRGDGIGLAMRRLSIIDLDTGNQPIANEDRTVWVVFNGEIYNYRDLRRTLEQKGHRFSTAGDTEVLVHLYEEYGEEGVHLLRGMFAYAIWDTARRRLLLARDRLGIKPMYYRRLAGGGLAFASEAKALFAGPGGGAEIDLESLDQYLTFQYVPGPKTMFKDVSKLPPGHILIADGRGVTVRRFWDTVFWIGERGVDFDDAAEEFKQLFSEAVRTHLVSDVPIGVLLSGGIDSSAVVGAMTAGGLTPQTFSVGFDMPGLRNELDDARIVAKHFGTRHHEIVVRADVADFLPRLMWHMDEPVADPAAVPTYLLCRFAQQHVRVVLTGEGGDELVAGYPRYLWFIVAKRLERLMPSTLRRALLPLTRVAPIGARRRRAIDNILGDADTAERSIRWIANFDSELKWRVLSPELSRESASSSRAENLVRSYLGADAASLTDLVHRLMALDIHTWLVDDILVKMDKMSMAASVEARVPFLDHHLMEFMTALPVSVKVRTFGTKRLLRHAMRSVLPRHTLARRKHAFAVPVDEWLRGPLRTFLGDVL
ncbi:MAG TPA: asparagine synthase (glutamine-hydrolyzing), partial [Vicinamibacterales bacterium]|nr:asparagine synthase (glutamine-hydrolyzing) [Vicinamibacterales bacterium]